jgi:nicotinamidase-related amidase
MAQSTLSSVALVIIDLQRDFVSPGTNPISTVEKAFCVPSAERLLGYARELRWRIVHVGTRHNDGKTMPLHQRRRNTRPYCLSGTNGCDFVLGQEDGEQVIYKASYSAFWETTLDRAVNGAHTLVFAGVAADCCIQQSVFDAERRGFRSVIPLQAVSASSGDAFVSSLLAMDKSAGDVVDLDTLLKYGMAETQPLPAENIRTLAQSWFRDSKSLVPTAPLA